MDEVPWPLVVMVFIGFLGWLRNRIVEAAELRRERAEARRREKPRPGETVSSPYRQDSATRQEETELDDADLPSSLRDLMAQMMDHEEEQQKAADERQRRRQEHREEEARTVSHRPTPPPLPDKSTEIELATIEAPDKTAEVSPDSEVGGMADIPTPESRPAGVPVDSYHSRRKRRNATVRRVVHSFRDRQSIQSALILKEILDTPKGLQQAD